MRNIFVWLMMAVVFIGILSLPLSSYAAGIGDGDPSPKPSRWTISGEAMFFERLGTDKYSLVERVPGTAHFFPEVPIASGTQALTSDDLKQGFAPGFKLEATYHFDAKDDLSLSFFRIAEWDSSKSIGPDNPLNWLVMHAPGDFFQTQDFATQSMKWDYSSELYNAEINVERKCSDQITLLAGFRWIQLYENLQGNIPPGDTFVPTWKQTNPTDTLNDVAGISSGIPAGEYPPFWDTSTTNDLYGFQIGANSKILEQGRFCLSGLVKVGGYWNHAREESDVSIGKIIYTTGGATDHPAFAGETGLQCKYKITDSLTLRFGYEVLFLTGVALAPGQIQNTYSASSPTRVYTLGGVNCDSYALFHGCTVGLEYLF